MFLDSTRLVMQRAQCTGTAIRMPRRPYASSHTQDSRRTQPSRLFVQPCPPAPRQENRVVLLPQASVAFDPSQCSRHPRREMRPVLRSVCAEAQNVSETNNENRVPRHPQHPYSPKRPLPAPRTPMGLPRTAQVGRQEARRPVQQFCRVHPRCRAQVPAVLTFPVMPRTQ